MRILHIYIHSFGKNLTILKFADSKPLTLFAQFVPHCPLLAQALIASMAYLKQNFNWINMLQPSQMGPQS